MKGKHVVVFKSRDTDKETGRVELSELEESVMAELDIDLRSYARQKLTDTTPSLSLGERSALEGEVCQAMGVSEEEVAIYGGIE